jgi:hypothetical protein
MLSSEIVAFISQYPHLQKWFLGIFNSDTLPRKIPPNFFLIVNKDLSTERGSHWYCLFRVSKAELECFDSLGVDENRLTLLKSVNFLGVRHIDFNKNQVQSDQSVSCGEFCLYFIFERLHNLDFGFSELLNDILVHDTEENEKRVTEFYEKFKHGFVD